jgi:hypothetical protein
MRMRDECPVEQHAYPSLTLRFPAFARYDHTLNSTLTNISYIALRRFGKHDKGSSEMCVSQHIDLAALRHPLDESVESAFVCALGGGAMAVMDLK